MQHVCEIASRSASANEVIKTNQPTENKFLMLSKQARYTPTSSSKFRLDANANWQQRWGQKRSFKFPPKNSRLKSCKRMLIPALACATAMSPCLFEQKGILRATTIFYSCSPCTQEFASTRYVHSLFPTPTPDVARQIKNYHLRPWSMLNGTRKRRRCRSEKSFFRCSRDIQQQQRERRDAMTLREGIERLFGNLQSFGRKL